jgi:hypothetical protein
VPTIEHAIKDSALDMLMRIVEAGRTLDRKRQWLQLLSQDTFFTSNKSAASIQMLHEKRGLEGGEERTTMGAPRRAKRKRERERDTISTAT